MVEHGGDHIEERWEVTREGGTPGYFSLDQARAVALQQARDNQDFYGPRYSAQDLVWEVLSQKERRDYYDIRLA